jgi:hypothetical protein
LVDDPVVLGGSVANLIGVFSFQVLSLAGLVVLEPKMEGVLAPEDGVPKGFAAMVEDPKTLEGAGFDGALSSDLLD